MKYSVGWAEYLRTVEASWKYGLVASLVRFVVHVYSYARSQSKPSVFFRLHFHPNNESMAFLKFLSISSHDAQA